MAQFSQMRLMRVDFDEQGATAVFDDESPPAKAPDIGKRLVQDFGLVNELLHESFGRRTPRSATLAKGYF